jgi:two-component system phosphate regulon sensor histidine kinase PhoR
MLKRKRLLWQLYPSYLLITIICLVVVTWYASRSLRHFYIDQSAIDLEARAHLLEQQFREVIDPLDTKAVDLLCKKIGKSASTRITIILPTGKVVGDSDEDPRSMDNHANRPEVRLALNGQVGTSIRYSRTVRTELMYLAWPMTINNGEFGVLRVSIPMNALDKPLRNIEIKIVAVGLVIAILAAGLSLLVSRRISSPIEQFKKWAESISRGELQVRPPFAQTDEMAGLSEAMNKMTSQLVDRIETEERQRNEMEAVLSSMVEGVIAVDMEERVINMNQAAAEMLSCDPSKVQGRSIQEVARNVDLQNFIKSALATHELIEMDIVLYADGEHILNLRGTMLRDGEGHRMGALIVLDDVTRLRKLENIRKEFVANVSHELKTPITAIKGFSETLCTGDVNDPVDAKRFLEIIDKNANRLESIVEDLLSLSKIEREEERKEIILEEGSIKEVMKSAMKVYQTKANEKNIKIDLQCDEDIRAHMNAPLLELAVGNLLDNAIKYSNARSNVRSTAMQTEEEVIIQIQDHGIGIAKENLPRLFERFYRVDKARSRKMGGTGLGLALVKHIVQAHGGQVSVESTPGKGSTVTISLPKG